MSIPLTAAGRAYALCVLETARLLIRHQLRLPRTNVGRWLPFADGTVSRVYRETIRTGVATARPTTLVVQFRLRLIGRSRLMHALFRAESLLNTVLFAGFPGFRSKLWATDERTAVYRGVYEWDGAAAAHSYATTLTALLRLLSAPGTVRYHVEPGVRRDDFLQRPQAAGGIDPDLDGWWQLRDTTPPGER